MASIRTTRALAALAALPLAFGVMGGVAQAAMHPTAAGAQETIIGTVGGTGVGHEGNSNATVQTAGGSGSNQNNSANVIGSGDPHIQQHNTDDDVVVVFESPYGGGR
ncbi:hypothetical protein ACTWP5_28870 [Streptomyces sp. 4N509B]|uniref:hypothetical protein n=1 Tax=Streptomyces sp. 4N509B TaxID=3457413 RepID=UPI003FD1CBAD